MLELLKRSVKKEPKELIYANLFEKIEELENDNELLKDENQRLNDMCFNLTQENSLSDNYIKELESDLEDYYKIQDKEQEKLENLLLYGDDYYNVRELERKQTITMIDKISEERNTYKEVINIMCDKFNIPHDSVLDIIDNISQNKSVEIERV